MIDKWEKRVTQQGQNRVKPKIQSRRGVTEKKRKLFVASVELCVLVI